MPVTLDGPVGLRWRKQNVTNNQRDQQKIIDLLWSIPTDKGGKKGLILSGITVAPPLAGPNKFCPQVLADAIWDFQVFWKSSGIFQNIDGVVDPNMNTLKQLNLLASGGSPAPIPPNPAPKPVPIEEFDDWYVTNLSLTGVSVAAPIGGGAFTGPIVFEHLGTPLGRERVQGNMWIAGFSAGLSGGLPGLQGNSIAAKVVKFLADNSGFSIGDLPAGTRGICVAKARTKLMSTSFFGGCLTHFLSANVFVGGYGAWLLFFGLPASGNWVGRLATGAVFPGDIGESAKGFAIIAGGGLGISLSAGGSYNYFAGDIK
ncbi:hypothetical protein SAZ10_13785 [Mesorhizobium sp. BAC0120]|uniref:hypothetical protein n=1 Tax=Mesorhizobium sp. BAC0120 TaxID=3090670 RepID=UPI00298BC976|nr:hypothetical protein [Mesorhizobium sp. BAC0120]MDW6022830.1 hypothetical protein [Mesorhizobium sp. BAC0120]